MPTNVGLPQIDEMDYITPKILDTVSKGLSLQNSLLFQTLVESILPTYTSLIMANSKLKTDDTMLQEVPYSVMEVMPVETGYTETGWVNKQLLPLDLSSYGPYAAIMNPVKDLQVISMDQMMFIQPQPFVTPTQVMTTQQASPKSESTEPRKSSSDESDKAREDTKPTLERVYSKLSAEELLVIQNRVRESLLKQGVVSHQSYNQTMHKCYTSCLVQKLYPPDGMEGAQCFCHLFL